MTLRDDERRKRMIEIINIRSEKNKVGVPKDRRFLSPEQAASLRDCEDEGWLTWIDSERHPAFGWRDLDIYLVTPAGLAAATLDTQEHGAEHPTERGMTT